MAETHSFAQCVEFLCTFLCASMLLVRALKPASRLGLRILDEKQVLLECQALGRLVVIMICEAPHIRAGLQRCVWQAT